ncbi:MAG: ABC transporter substrate-binding protein [Chloroflexota bacterium]|nr:ABC transporter substrate-binding protein [Chloroflexota bacterium]
MIDRQRLTRRGILALGAAGTGGLLIAACGVATMQPAETEAAMPEKEAESAYEPVTIENCGITITYEQPPKRAVALAQHATEVMLTLGLQDQMVGTAYLEDPILPDLADAYAQVPVLSDTYPSREVFLGAEPDFVYGGWSSAFKDEVAGSRESLLELNIGSYLAHANCLESKATIEDVFTDFLTIGKIFGVSERAEAYVAGKRERLAEIHAITEGVDAKVKVFVYDSGDEAPYTAAGTGIVNALLEEAGGINIFADVEGGFATVNWEAVIERDPDVIVLHHATWSTAEEKIEYLKKTEVLAALRAVQEERFVIVEFTATQPGPRSVDVIETLFNGFYPE